MQSVLRASLAVLSIVTCADAGAAARRNCVTSLEAQPRAGASATASVVGTPRKPCLVAVGLSRRVPAPREAVIDAAPDHVGRARV